MKNHLLLILFFAVVINSFSQNLKDTLIINTIKWNCEDIIVDCFFQSSSMTDSYHWDFGDGSTFSSIFSNSAKHRYNTIGTYSITLIITKDGVNDTIIRKDAITVRNSPIANYVIDSTNFDFYAPSNVSFINTSFKGDGDSLTYTWSVNNSEFSHEIHPSYIFQNPNIYEISLMVEDEFGCESNYSKNFIIKDSLQRNEFNYTTNHCANFGIIPSNSKTLFINNDTLFIKGILNLNCCTEHTATANIDDDGVVFIKTYESGPLCACDCNFEFEIKIPDIYTDSVNVYFDGQKYIASRGYDAINKIQYNNTFKIYPNPATDKLIIESINKDINFSHIEILNVLGKNILSKNKAPDSQTTIDLNGIKSGIYLVNIIENDRCIYSKKLMLKQ